MARSHARVLTSIWSDADFTRLSTDAQWLYVAILSQPSLSFAGVVALTPRRWAGFSRTMTPAKIAKALAELVAADFVIYDENTEEIAVRSFMKNDGILTSPNVMKAAAREYLLIVSATVRSAVLASVPPEQRAVFETDAATVPEPLPEGFPEGFPDSLPEGSRPRSAGPPSPFKNSSSLPLLPAPASGAEPSAESAAASEAGAGRNGEEEDEEELKDGTITAAADVLARRDLQRKLSEGGRVGNRKAWLRAAAANRLDADGQRLALIAAADPDLDGNQLADALDRQAVHRPEEYKPEGVGLGVKPPPDLMAKMRDALGRVDDALAET